MWRKQHRFAGKKNINSTSSFLGTVITARWSKCVSEYRVSECGIQTLWMWNTEFYHSCTKLPSSSLHVFFTLKYGLSNVASFSVSTGFQWENIHLCGSAANGVCRKDRFATVKYPRLNAGLIFLLDPHLRQKIHSKILPSEGSEIQSIGAFWPIITSHYASCRSGVWFCDVEASVHLWWQFRSSRTQWKTTEYFRQTSRDGAAKSVRTIAFSQSYTWRNSDVPFWSIHHAFWIQPH